MAAVRRQRLMMRILDAIRSMREANGSTLKKIISHMKSNSAPHVPKSHVASRVRKVIKEAVNGGILHASNGLFKIDVTYEAEVNRSLRESLGRASRAKKRGQPGMRSAHTGRRYIFHCSKTRRKQRRCGRPRRRRSRHRRRRGRLLCRKVLRRCRPRQKRREVAAAAPLKDKDATLRDESPSVKEGRAGRRKRQPSYRYNKTIIKKVSRLRTIARVNRQSRIRVRRWVGECPVFPLDDACAADVNKPDTTME